MDMEKIVALGEFINKSLFDGSAKTNSAFDEGVILFTQQVLALLKEQEAVKRTSRTGINGFSIIWTCGACGSDLYPNNAKAKYCSNCGQAVKWDA